MAASPLLEQKSRSPLLPQFGSSSQRHHQRSASTSSEQSSSTIMKKSRFTQGRVILLICVASMMLAMVHIHYTNVYRQEREQTIAPDQDLHPSHPEALPEHGLPPSTGHQPPVSETPAPSPDVTGKEPTFTTTETQLTTTYHYSNGTLAKEFKAAFYKDPKAARKEMGSFMETLAKRTWWEHTDSTLAANPDLHGTAPNKAFFAYLPMGGGNNQFTSLQKAALLAKDLKRTLLIPPISPNSHIKVWAGPRYSEFYDLETFSAQSGIPVLEWHDIKQTPENPPADLTHHWANFAEDFPCVVNGGIGVNNEHLYDHFRTQFLLNFKSTAPPVVDKSMGRSAEYLYARDVLLKDKPNEAPEMFKCLSCPYFLGGAELSDRAWDEIGLHLRFNNKLETMADDILDVLLPTPTKDLKALPDGTPRRHPEFIIVHLRRGDIVTKCKPHQEEKECLVQIEQIADKVDEIEEKRRNKALAETTDKDADVVFERLPVLVTTNEKRPEELEKLEKLGWIMLDHGDVEVDAEGKELPSKTKRLGTMTALGPFYPPMLDAVLLTRGDYLIGMSNSRMSQLATQRGAAWHKHTTMLM